MEIPPPVVEVVPLAKLQPWAKNPRKFHAVAQIARSVQSFGYAAPILVQKDTYRILAGHGRLEALKSLGVEKVPVLVLDMDDDRADLYTLADNKLTESAEWDFGMMADLLLEFDAKNLDVSLTGFSQTELEEIANWTPKNETPETGGAPAVQDEAVSALGDLWQMGNHRLLCGDSTKAEAVARVMDGRRAGLMNTDPPYGVNYAAVKNGIPGSGFRDIQERGGDIENDDLTDGAALQAFLESMIRAAIPCLIENPAFYLWHPMLTQGTFFAAAAAAADILIHRQIIWVKPHMVLTRSGMYHWKHELCFYGWIRGKPCEWLGDKSQVSVWELGESSQDREHPTQKPVELFTRPIKNHLKQGDICYEPFSGSGSQYIAAEQAGVRCYGLEIEPRYVDVAVRRWQNFTGERAKNVTRPEVTIS